MQIGTSKHLYTKMFVTFKGSYNGQGESILTNTIWREAYIHYLHHQWIPSSRNQQKTYAAIRRPDAHFKVFKVVSFGSTLHRTLGGDSSDNHGPDGYDVYFVYQQLR